MGLSEKYINFLNHPTVEATINFIKKFKSSKSYWSVSYFILLFTIREAIAWKFGSAIKTFCEAQAVDSSFPMVWSVLGFVFDVGGSIELVLLGILIFVLLSLVKVAESEGTSVSVRENYLTLFLIVFVGAISFVQSSETLTIVEDTNKAVKEIKAEQNESKHLRNDLEREREKYAKLEKEFYALRKSVQEKAPNDNEIIDNANQILEEQGFESAIFYLKFQLSYLKHVEKSTKASETNIKVSEFQKETIQVVEDIEEENNETIIISKKSETKWITPSDSTCTSNGGEVNSDGCKSNWEDAKAICVANGGSLPSIEELSKVVTDCDGEMKDNNKEEWERNRNNAIYQSCYKKKGFASSYYWSSTTHANYSRLAWAVDFSSGRRYDYFKDVNNYVRCVRAGQ